MDDYTSGKWLCALLMPKSRSCCKAQCRRERSSSKTGHLLLLRWALTSGKPPGEVLQENGAFCFLFAEAVHEQKHSWNDDSFAKIELEVKFSGL